MKAHSPDNFLLNFVNSWFLDPCLCCVPTPLPGAAPKFDNCQRSSELSHWSKIISKNRHWYISGLELLQNKSVAKKQGCQDQKWFFEEDKKARLPAKIFKTYLSIRKNLRRYWRSRLPERKEEKKHLFKILGGIKQLNFCFTCLWFSKVANLRGIIVINDDTWDNTESQSSRNQLVNWIGIRNEPTVETWNLWKKLWYILYKGFLHQILSARKEGISKTSTRITFFSKQVKYSLLDCKKLVVKMLYS